MSLPACLCNADDGLCQRARVVDGALRCGTILDALAVAQLMGWHAKGVP